MAAVEQSGAVNALNASERVLQCFWDLAALEEGARVKAAQQLRQDACEDQQQQPPAAVADAAEPVPKGRQLEHALRKCSPVMTYVLRRLAKGVASGRAAARQGYATALTAVLDAAHTHGNSPLLGADDSFVLLDSCIESGGKGGEARDAFLGRLFGMAAMVRAGMVKDAASAARVITALLSLANKKAVLREAAVSVIVELLTGGPSTTETDTAGNDQGAVGQNGNAANGSKAEKGGKSSKKRKASDSDTQEQALTNGVVTSGRWLPEGVVRRLLSSGPDACEPLRKTLTGSAQDANPEVLLLALCLWPYMPSELVAVSPLPHQCPAPPITWLTHPHTVPHSTVAPQAAALFAPAYLKQVLPGLQHTTSSTPRLHMLWSHLLTYLLPGFTTQQRKAPEAVSDGVSAGTQAAGVQLAHVNSLWQVVVEEGLFGSNSHERKYLGFQLFLVMLPRLPASAVSGLFSRNFSRTLVTNINKADSYLHAMAKKVMERVQQFLARAPDAAAKLSVSAALQRMAGLGFQQQAASKTTASLLQGMDEQGVQSYCQQYMKAFLQGSEAIPGDQNGNPAGRLKQSKQDESEQGDSNEAEDKDEDELSRAVERRRAAAVDQLVAALRFPASTDELRLQVLRFLAACAFFQPVQAAPASAKKQSKKQPAAVQPVELSLVQEAAAAGATPLSAATRSVCAQRLVAAVVHAPVAAQQAIKAGKKGGEVAEQQPNKKAKTGEATPDASSASTERDAARLLGPVCAYTRQLQSHAAVAQLAAGELPEQADVGLTVLRELEDALQPVAASAAASQGKEGDEGDMNSPATRAARARALLHLVQLLQLHVVGDVAGAPDTSLIYDLRRVTKEAAGLQLPDMEEEAVEDKSEGNETEESEDTDEAPAGAQGEAAPAWSEVLLDVLLSLLSRPSAPLPSAPLRTACEAVWRSCCEALTPAGMLDLLRVIAARQTAAGGDEDEGVLAGGADEEEEEEEVELEVGSHSSDEDSDDNEAPEAANGSTPQTQGKIKETQKRKRDESDEDSDDESEPADDEEMFKMDSKLAAYMRAVADKRKNAREMAAALSALQFRVLTLLEIFARKASSSPLLLLTLLPLVRTLRSAARTGPGHDNALAARITVLLNKYIGKAKPVFDAHVLPAKAKAATEASPESNDDDAAGAAAGTTADVSLSFILNRLLYYAARSEDKTVASAAGAALALALRAAAAADDADARTVGEAALQATLTDFFSKKKSRLHVNTVQACCSRPPQLSLALSSGPLSLLLKQASGGARNAFKQVEAVELLTSMLRVAVGPTSNITQEQLAGLLKPHGSALGAVLESVAAGAGMKPNQHADAAKACVGLVEVIKKLLPAGRKLGELLGPERLRGVTKAVATVRDLGIPERVNTQLSRLAQSLGLTEPLAAAGADPALKARLQKARSGSGTAAAAGKGGKHGNQAAAESKPDGARVAKQGGSKEQQQEGKKHKVDKQQGKTAAPMKKVKQGPSTDDEERSKGERKQKEKQKGR